MAGFGGQQFIAGICCWALLQGSGRCDAGTNDAGDSLNQSAAEIASVIECVLSHHIAAPTRQQMVLEVLGAVAAAKGRTVPPDLSSRVSAVSDVHELHQMLRDEWHRLSPEDSAAGEMKAHALQRLSNLVAGGIVVIPEKEYRINEQLAANRYVGIGIQVAAGDPDEGVRIVKAFEGGSASEAGILDGDFITAVDRQSARHVPLDEVVDWLRGPADSTVEVTVQSGDDPERVLLITRKVVPIRTVHVIPSPPAGNAALIRLDRLTASTMHELRKICDALPEKVRTVILDLRFCSESSLHHLHLFGDAILDHGSLGYVESRTGRRELPVEPGNVLQGRRAVMLYHPGQSPWVRWLASALHSAGIAVCRDEFGLPQESVSGMPDWSAQREFVPLQDETLYAGLVTVRLLTVNGEELPAADAPGIPIARTEQSRLTWPLSIVAGDSGGSIPASPPDVSSAPSAEVNGADAGPRPGSVPRPVSDDEVIERIMSLLPSE